MVGTMGEKQGDDDDIVCFDGEFCSISSLRESAWLKGLEDKPLPASTLMRMAKLVRLPTLNKDGEMPAQEPQMLRQ